MAKAFKKSQLKQLQTSFTTSWLLLLPAILNQHNQRKKGMKRLLLVLSILSISCRGVEIARFVNDQNDGFNAYNISLRNDSSYAKEELFSSQTGKYAISDTIILFKSGIYKGKKINFHKDSSGCINDAILVDADDAFEDDLRVIFDSLSCKINHHRD